MTVLALQKDILQPLAPRAVLPDQFLPIMEGWLAGDFQNNNIAPLMYVGDTDAKRWKKGHSSRSYYVKRDEIATHELVMRDITGQFEHFIDLGVGGTDAVTRALLLARKLGVKTYVGFDNAPALTQDAALFANENGFEAEQYNCDIFKPLRIKKPSSFIALLGLTVGNLETYSDLTSLKERLIGIWKNYANAVTGRTAANNPESNLLVSYDANMNIDEVLACYNTLEMGELIRSGPGRFMDMSKFDYAIQSQILKSKADDGQQALFVSLGLRARETHIVSFNGKRFFIEAGHFMPVINTVRFSKELMTATAQQAGWTPKKIWSATGRVQYQNFSIS